MKTISALIMMGLASGALANNYTCTNGGNERSVAVVYTTPGQVVPCEVVYTKEGSSETLWRAQNEAGYCEAQADSFADKLRGWGWDCTYEGGAASQAAEEEGPVEGADGN